MKIYADREEAESIEGALQGLLVVTDGCQGNRNKKTRYTRRDKRGKQ